MLLTHPSQIPGVVADVLYAFGDERLVIAVDSKLKHRDTATAVITDLVAMCEERADLLDDIREVASTLSWDLKVEVDGAQTLVTVS